MATILLIIVKFMKINKLLWKEDSDNLHFLYLDNQGCIVTIWLATESTHIPSRFFHYLVQQSYRIRIIYLDNQGCIVTIWLATESADIPSQFFHYLVQQS